MTSPIEKVVVRFDEDEGEDDQTNYSGTWINALEAVECGCDPEVVAARLIEILGLERCGYLADEAPTDAWSDPVPYDSASARLCWAMGAATGSEMRWAPKITAPARSAGSAEAG